MFYTPDTLARGLRRRLDYHAWRDRRLSDGFSEAPALSAEQHRAIARLRAAGRTTLSESESKQLIAAWGIPVTREVLASSAEAAVEAAERLGYPVALKVDSPDIPHKTEAGGVRLDVQSAEEVRRAYTEIMATALAHAPDATVSGVLVQEMVTEGVEVIVGVSYDAQLGPVLLFGTGGVMVEVYDDIAMRRCPLTFVREPGHDLGRQGSPAPPGLPWPTTGGRGGARRRVGPRLRVSRAPHRPSGGAGHSTR